MFLQNPGWTDVPGAGDKATPAGGGGQPVSMRRQHEHGERGWGLPAVARAGVGSRGRRFYTGKNSHRNVAFLSCAAFPQCRVHEGAGSQ